jgi:serine/threonine protein kinase
MLNYPDYFRNFNPLNRYQLQEKLGKGAYGEVYKAVNSKTGVTVALKKPAQVNGDIFKRFCNEIEFYKRTSNSPFVLKMSDYSVSQSSPFLVTEYCNLGNVRSRLWELKINRTRTILLLWQAANALADVHSHGMLHRDIKPDNLLLKNDPQNNWTLKLGDPGLACFPARSIFDFGATRTARGTEFYIAPEMYLPGATFTAAADTFSFGVTAYEMLMSERVVAGSTVSNLGKQLNSLLTQMISLNTQERPQMKLVMNELSAIYQSEVKKAQNRVEIGGAIVLLGLIGLGGYVLLKESK